MKIKLRFMQEDGNVIFHEVKASMPFKLFGYTFAVHPVANPDGTFKDPKKCGWFVTEASCGAIAACGELRREAIEKAKKAVTEAGHEETTRVIKSVLEMRRRMQ